MTSRYLILLLCVALTTTCSDAAEHNPTAERLNQEEELRRYLATPQYGREKALAGKLMFSRETSIIGLCDKERSACELPLNADGSEQSCWLTLTERGSADLRRLSRADYVENGEYWIEGMGRIAVLPGGFGHMSAYTCQVEFSSLRAFEIGPPYFWEPPPLER